MARSVRGENGLSVGYEKVRSPDEQERCHEQSQAMWETFHAG
jgi:hypothetical protein